jgi:F-type H+-transporting ATPase subunit b
MEQTLQDLADLVLSALPTTLLAGFLVIVLNAVLFRPLAAVIAQRDAATKGALEQARAAIQQAEDKVAEYEKALRNARGEILREQEAQRLRLREQQAAAIAAARECGQALIDDAKRQLRMETEAARSSLRAGAEQLAEAIASSVSATGRRGETPN